MSELDSERGEREDDDPTAMGRKTERPILEIHIYISINIHERRRITTHEKQVSR